MDGVLEGDSLAKIRVVGVGGGGCNAVSRMTRDKMTGVQFVGLNTDAQGLTRCDLPIKVRIGEKLTRGLGVGGNPELGRQAAEESREVIEEVLRDSDMVFIAAGMGGGTGTGAAPVVAEVAKQVGALTVAVVTRPFSFEGAKRKKLADEGINRLKDKVDTLIMIPNDRLLTVCGEQRVTVENAFKMADDVLRQGIQAISEIITIPGDINLDFADVKTIMTNAGSALMAIGTGKGDKRAEDAANTAINNPLQDVSIEGARGVLMNITGGNDLTLAEVHAASNIVSKAIDPEALLIFGVVTDLKMDDQVKITLIATGIRTAEERAAMKEDRLKSQGLLNLDEAELDIPPFLRRHPALRSRGNGHPASVVGA